MTAIAPTQRNSATQSQHAEGGAFDAGSQQPSHVIESSAEQPWAEFCQGLKAPAFLLAVTGFGDLE